MQNGIYGQIGQYRSGSQSSSPHVSFAMDHPTSPSATAVSVQNATLLPHPNYSHQLSMEDQGIDLTQSPGRESPSSSSSTVSVGLKSNISGGSSSGSATSAILPGSSSSCRHSTTSTTSLDSGRASGTYDIHHHHHAAGQRHGSTSSTSTTSTFHQGGQLLLVQHQQQQRFSGQSYESCLRNSYHSSSSSLGSSGGKIDDIHRLNISEMLSQGVPVISFLIHLIPTLSDLLIYRFLLRPELGTRDSQCLADGSGFRRILRSLCPGRLRHAHHHQNDPRGISYPVAKKNNIIYWLKCFFFWSGLDGHRDSKAQPS